MGATEQALSELAECGSVQEFVLARSFGSLGAAKAMHEMNRVLRVRVNEHIGQKTVDLYVIRPNGDTVWLYEAMTYEALGVWVSDVMGDREAGVL